jgi:hypothetical protein
MTSKPEGPLLLASRDVVSRTAMPEHAGFGASVGSSPCARALL